MLLKYFIVALIFLGGFSRILAQNKAKLYLIHTESGIDIPTTSSNNIGGLKLTTSSAKNKTVIHVFANGNKICKGIQNNKYKVYDIAPGSHELRVKTGLLAKRPETLQLNVQAEKEYYILMDIETKMFKDVFTFTELSKENFDEISVGLKKAKKGC